LFNGKREGAITEREWCSEGYGRKREEEQEFGLGQRKATARAAEGANVKQPSRLSLLSPSLSVRVRALPLCVCSLLLSQDLSRSLADPLTRPLSVSLL